MSTKREAFVDKDGRAKTDVERKKILECMKAKDREPVKGIFRFHEVPGGSMSFNYKKYKGEPVERFDLKDGEVYTIPLGVAKHLNKNGWYPVHSYRQNENGASSMMVGKKVRRFSFQSLEFVDMDDLTADGEPLIIPGV